MTSSVLRRTKATIQPLAIALSISAAFSPFSFAQSSTDSSLAPVLVTATRTAQKASDVLSDNIVITSDEIQQSGQSSLLDLLQRKRGIEISRNGGAGSSSSLYMRGSTAKQVVLLIDGVRSGSSTSGEPSWSALPLSQIERVEIVFGPMSSFYGADAVGGVIQVFTKRGSGAPRVTASAGFGTYGTQEYSLGVSGSTEGDHKIRYAISTGQEEADGFNVTNPLVGTSYRPDIDGYTKTSNSAQFSWELAKGQELGLNVLNSRNNAQYDANTAFDARNIGEVDVYSIYSRNQITANWSSIFQVARTYDKGNSYTTPLPAGRSTFNTEATQISWQNDIKLGTDVLQVIAERRDEDVESTSASLNRGRDTKSLAVAYLLKRGAHLGSISTRYDDSSAYGSHVTGSLGYGYRITDALRFSGSVGTSFRAPTFNELYFAGYGNVENRPEEGKNAELGMYYDDGKSDFSVAYYRNQITDLLINQRCVGGPANSSCAYNVNEALLTGLSIGAGTRLGNFRLYGALDLQNPMDETTNKQLERRARYHGSLGLEHKAEKIRTGVDVVFSGSRFNNAANTQTLGGYALLNMHVSYELTGDWQLFARWNNMLDKKYSLARGYETAGSNALVGVRYGFY